MSPGELEGEMVACAAEIEQEIEALLRFATGTPPRLVEAMRHAALGGGKRLRPFLVHACAGLGTADPAAVRRVGAAIELLHCYSLIHDDLPAMDDAALRRGKPACHKAFDEATAILAGDALQALAFEVLAREDWPASSELRCGLILGLAQAAGAPGMCGGQQLDLEAEHRALGEAEITALQRMKTGALIAFAFVAGARLGGLEEGARASIRAYADRLGLAFQIKDDLLDAVGDAAAIGKDAGVDVAHGKATFVTLLGLDGALEKLKALQQEADGLILGLGERSRMLTALFDFVLNRRA